MLIFTLLFSGCSADEIPEISESEASSETVIPSSESSETGSYVSDIVPEYSLSSDCVPDWSVSSHSSDPSYVHSTDTSSNISSESQQIDYAFQPKAVAGSGYHIISELIPPDGEFGTADDLERWKSAVLDTESIYKLVVYYVECEDRYLSGEEVHSLLSELQSLFPKVYEEPENPATGGSYTVAAYGFDGEIKWIMSWGSFFTVYFPEDEKTFYFNGNDLYFSSLVRISDYRSPMSHP